MKQTESINKTYCEVEEERHYSSLKHKKINVKPLFLIITIFLMSFFAISASIFSQEKYESINYWDGAGDTWICNKCGTKNYNWQASCGSCRSGR